MADSNSAPRQPPQPRRLTKAPPEIALAQRLFDTEYGVRNERRGGEDDLNLAERLWEALRETWRSLTGGGSQSDGSQSDGSWSDGAWNDGSWRGQNQGMGPAGGGQEREPFGRGGYAPQPERQPQPSAFERASHPALAPLDRAIGRLSPREHEAFEDALLHMVRTEPWKDVFGAHRAQMPMVDRYVANAHAREALRQSWQESVRARAQSARQAAFEERFVRPADSRGAARDAPVTGTDRPRDQRAMSEQRTTETRSADSRWERVDSAQTFDGQGYRAAEHARRTDAEATSPTSSTPVSTPSTPPGTTSPTRPAAPASLVSREGLESVHGSYRTPVSPRSSADLSRPTTPQHAPAPKKGRAM
ncbi:hypothetical protein ACIQNU_25060 [Streptomyces sp. NPDC091292]|uniref:hypothetical protein n=1 Tax=Streptomyces sp. NPDC091292 TaxID=3365991 RepID=UPI003808C666